MVVSVDVFPESRHEPEKGGGAKGRFWAGLAESPVFELVSLAVPCGRRMEHRGHQISHRREKPRHSG